MNPGNLLKQKLQGGSAFRKKLASFSRSLRIPTRVIDAAGLELWHSRNFPAEGRFCLLANQELKSNSCRFSHQNGARESIRWGVPAIGTCCFSIYHITAPIMESNRLAGCLKANPFLMADPFELKFEEISSLLKGPPAVKKKIFDALSRIPVLKEEEVNRAAQELFALANKLSHPDLSCLGKVREIQDLQGKVAEEIQAVKSANPEFTPSQLFKLSYDTEREIIHKICGGEQEKAKEILNKLLAIILSQYLSDIDLLKISILELVVVISRAAVEAGAKVEDILGLKYQCLAELGTIKNQEEICLWTVKVVDNVIDNIYHSRNIHLDSRLKKTLEFIDRHYGSDLTVERVAREAFLSPSRFSHLFKDEMGLPFIEYLTKVRMQNARSFLRDPEKSVAQVALEVGYSDQSYFTKVFKKSEAITPKFFRRSLLPPSQGFIASPNGGWK